MNIFVLCTGRCGSTTFIRACQHITNYTALHESRTGLLGDDRFDYGEDHIEADNRLSWLLGRLELAYGRDALYVHLERDERDTAASFVHRVGRGIMRAYGRGGVLMDLPENADPMAMAEDYCRTVTTNIKLFLRDKPQQMSIKLESVRSEFPEFCGRIAATVDMDAALAELDLKHNATRKRGGPHRARKVLTGDGLEPSDRR